MSSLAQNAKMKMAGMLQKLLSKLTPPPVSSAPPSAGTPAPITQVPTLQTTPGKAVPAPTPGVRANGKAVEFPLQSIIAGLPLELQPRLKSRDACGRSIGIPLERILAQLSSGAVKVPFGEVRQAAPDLFTGANDKDLVPVSIPLAEVLARLNPALIMRRRQQKLVEVPADIRSPFDGNGQGLGISVGPPASEGSAVPPGRQTAPVAPPAVVPPCRSSITFTPKPVPPSAPSLSLAPTPLSPIPTREAAAPTTPPPTPAPKPAASPEPLVVTLSSLAESWPEPIRKQILELKLAEATVTLPIEIIERALKQGRVAFSWKTLRSWLKPAPAPSSGAHDATILEVPLKIVAPLFLARQNEANKTKKRVAIDEDIPNLFFGFPQAESGAIKPTAPAQAPTSKPADTNYYIWDDNADRTLCPDDDAKRNPSPGTRFVAKYATPNEVVSRAASLDGVAGALIALPDGLMVASRLSSDLNGDTLAAFLPQIFAKVNQCTKELRMGELNNLNFTVGNVPWKIFRVNAIFFAAFGRAGEPLPTAKLAALAAELDHKPK
jgi:predicted regulator of Ras-like GTPase activity (Roadblock/LC7/MglB family)